MSLVYSRACWIDLTLSLMISSLPLRSLCSRWILEVAQKTWMRPLAACFTASPARSMSLAEHRARPQTTLRETSAAIWRTDSKSPSELMGKPASITSTPIDSRWRAISSFSGSVSVPPGACSPSRKVVSKMRTVSLAVSMTGSKKGEPNEKTLRSRS